MDHVAQQQRALGHLADPEDAGPPRGAVDPVHDVVEPRRQLVDVLGIERRDEGSIEPGDDRMGDVVGLVLECP